MSLQFIIDGYNIINHPFFRQHTTKKTSPVRNNGARDSRTALLEFIIRNRSCGSPKNKIIVVFDGYVESLADKRDKTDIHIIFSKRETADECIKKMAEESGNAKNTVVVSDDKEIRFFVRSIGAKAMGVEEFIGGKEKSSRNNVLLKPELTYAQMHKINQELKKIWLK